MKTADTNSTLESVVQLHFTGNLRTSQSSADDVRDLSSDKPLIAGPMRVSRLVCSHWRFVLKEPVLIQVSYEQGVWIQRYEPLDILAYGRFREEANEAFCEEFACCWEEIACEEDSKLTADAIALKSRLLSIVKDATPLE